MKFQRKLPFAPSFTLSVLTAFLMMSVIRCSHSGPIQADSGSAATGVATDLTSGRKLAAWLTEQDASARLARIKNIHYALKFKLDRTSEEFIGDTTIQFDLAENTAPLTIDFEDGQIDSVTNAKTAQPIPYQFAKHFITLTGGSLIAGQNSIRIQYHHAYSKSGDGFYRFKDPEDGEVYVYTNFEPYHANGLFPCFDQPSLKATYQISVTAPKDWSIVSSTRESGTKEINAELQTWTFPDSKPFSTYLVAVVGGPFKTWSDRAGEIPIRLMVRKSLAKYVRHADWLNVTKQGLKFYQKYFDFKYPFAKYDQIIVPDFNAGAMENVAAVTFSERYIIRGTPTDIEQEGVAGVILHEMAHMWFGDLVTMKWWNGLWLNESFATFMSYEASEKATRFKSAWESFQLGRKQWGYLEDQYVTTHPIETPVASTDVAESNFDGITYAKGASVLKQLNFYLTPEKFRAGVRLYFKKYQFKNTTTDDFFGALSEASGQNLTDWTATWLRSAGLNTLQADFGCKNGKMERVTLKQSGDAGLTAVRPNRVRVAFIKTHPLSVKTLDLISDVASLDVKEAVGLSCPDVVFPNYDDQAYVKVQLDETSKKNFLPLLSQGSFSAINRSLLWTSYWDSVRDGKTAAEDFLAHANQILPTEKDERVSDFLLTALVHSRFVSYLRSALFYLPSESARHQWRLKLEKSLGELLQKSSLSMDLRRSVFDAYIRVVTSTAALNQLLDTLEKKKTFYGIEIDQDRRWSTLAQLARNQTEGVDQAIQQEKKNDASHTGEQMAIAAAVVVPQVAAKEFWLNRFTQDHSISAADVRSASTWMFPDEQNEILQRELPKIKMATNYLAKNYDSSFVINAARGILPIDGRPESIQFLQTWWNEDHGWLPSAVERALRVAIQENQIAIRNRNVVSGHDE